MKASQDAGTKGEKPLQAVASGFFISVRVSLSDFRIFASAPAASRRAKMSVAKLSLGYLPKPFVFFVRPPQKMW